MNFLARFIFLIIILLISVICVCGNAGADPLNLDLDQYETVLLNDVESGFFNRTARKLTGEELAKLPLAFTGFMWGGKTEDQNGDNAGGDNNTDKWRPQGITGFTLDGKKFLAVSWYGREESDSETCPDEGCSILGARVSFVNISNMDSIVYRHVLLMYHDKEKDEYLTFGENLHAGGITYLDGKLHVVNDQPDGEGNQVYVFPIDQIKKVPVTDRNEAPTYGYGYILVAESSYRAPITPSFLSYDWDKEKMLVGTFTKCEWEIIGGKDFSKCHTNWLNRLAWYNEMDIALLNDPENLYPPIIEQVSPVFSEMQGAASLESLPPVYEQSSPTGALWVSRSYGQDNNSFLCMVKYDPSSPADSIQDAINNLEYNEKIYPPGLEDLYLSESKENLWTLTEFGPHEDKDEKGNNRVVFAMKTVRWINDYPNADPYLPLPY